MNHGELLTRLTVWLALIAGGLASAMMLPAPDRSHLPTRTRWFWTVGCAFFLAHVGCAFAFYHHWSHAAAVRETARQTAEVTGLKWGGGLWLNYLFAAVWLGDVLWWWLAPASFARRPQWLAAAWHGFFLFMVFNATVVFGHGPVRWLGVAICGGLAALWIREKSRAKSGGQLS